MAEYEVFPNAPVEEAIITIRLRSLEDLRERAESIQALLGGTYPVVEGADRIKDTSGTGTGIRLLAEDRRRAIQLTSQAFSYHLLRPYTHWKAFSSDARAAWDAFAEGSCPPVEEVQLRFVNEFHLPSLFEDWGEFLSIHPNLPPSLDTGLGSFWMTLELEDRSVPASAIVTQATEGVKGQSAPCVLDIDTRSLPIARGLEDSDQIWRVLDGLRDYKNRLFFEGLTERAKELFR